MIKPPFAAPSGVALSSSVTEAHEASAPPSYLHCIRTGGMGLSWSRSSTEQRERDINSIKLILHASDSTGGLGPLELKSLDIKSICSRVRPLLLHEPTLLRFAEGDFVVVGDLHGMLGSLKCIFSQFGNPPDCRYLFLGDYVDRGAHGIEIVSLLFLLKILYPKHVYLLRGNHECKQLNRIYGFEQECLKRLSRSEWRRFLRVFEALPLAAILQERIFCIHGGFSRSLESVEQINEITRPCTIPAQGLLHDILWTDPAPEEEERKSWGDSIRGSDHLYGRPVVEAFLRDNNIQLICRSHYFVEQGYEWRFDNQLITIFSAGGYCEPASRNRPAVLVVPADPSLAPYPVVFRQSKNDDEDSSL